ncbi:MAG: EVE domain-containing protein [Gammaproteobacteria bacterium]|nr:EVE domain-containing protein [Gammaproteobacteria bacterium]
MNYWLMKSEPSSFSIDDLARAPRRMTVWDGVRNFQVRNMLRDQISRGDSAFFYHSGDTTPGIAGIMRVSRSGYVDASAFDRKDPHFDPRSTEEKPLWYCVDVTLAERFRHIVTLSELRRHAALKDMLILRRGNRLSITPVSAKHWQYILKLAAHA